MIIFDLLIEAKNILSWHTLWHFNSTFESSLSASSAFQRFTKKWDQLWLSASISRILQLRPPGLDFRYTFQILQLITRNTKFCQICFFKNVGFAKRTIVLVFDKKYATENVFCKLEIALCVIVKKPNVTVSSWKRPNSVKHLSLNVRKN